MTLVTTLGRIDPTTALTVRELDVLSLMAAGRSNQGIAERLGLTSRTVESHVRRILIGLHIPEDSDCHRRVLAVRYVLCPGVDARFSGGSDVPDPFGARRSSGVA